MRGEVDEAGRALLTLRVRPVSASDPVELVVWVDTAFDGELVIPFDAIHDMELPQSAAVQATLADGTSVVPRRSQSASHGRGASALHGSP